MTSYFTKSLVYNLGVPWPSYLSSNSRFKKRDNVSLTGVPFSLLCPCPRQLWQWGKSQILIHVDWALYTMIKVRGKEDQGFPWESVYIQDCSFESWVLRVDDISLHLPWFWKNVTLHFLTSTTTCIRLDFFIFLFLHDILSKPQKLIVVIDIKMNKTGKIMYLHSLEWILQGPHYPPLWHVSKPLSLRTHFHLFFFYLLTRFRRYHYTWLHKASENFFFLISPWRHSYMCTFISGNSLCGFCPKDLAQIQWPTFTV